MFKFLQDVRGNHWRKGPLFENLVFSEIYKLIQNYDLGWQVFHWRSRTGEEIDFLIQMNPGKYLFAESKVSVGMQLDPSSFPEVKRVFSDKIPHAIVCHQHGNQVLGQVVPIAFLKNYLLSFC